MMVMVLSAVAAVVVARLGGLALVLHHQRAMRPRVEDRRPIVTYARLEPRAVDSTRRPAIGPVSVTAIRTDCQTAARQDVPLTRHKDRAALERRHG
ncbi:MAG: hypothetical protein WBH47_11235 [Streptosporangiaceae bacterium]